MIHQYRNVVYLNNASTTFMARGDYQQAIAALKDTLFLLETIVRPVASSLLKTSSPNDIDFGRKANNMLKHLSTPFILESQIKVNKVAQLLASCKTPKANGLLKVEVVCYDGSIESVVSLAEQHQKLCSKQRVLAIRISDLLVDGKFDLDEMYSNLAEIVPAIILSNYALAHFCLFRATNNYNALNGALRLFHMSMKVLCIREKLQLFMIDDSQAFHDDKFMYFSEGCMFVSLAISLNVQFIPIEDAIKCYTSPSPNSVSMTYDACAILQDLYTLRRFAGEWTISTSYQVTIAICKVSTYATNTATAA